MWWLILSLSVLFIGALVFWLRRSSLRELARDVSRFDADPERLRAASAHPLRVIRQAIAQNPNTPAELLITLAPEFPKEVSENPAFALVLLEFPDFFERVSPPFWLHPRLPMSVISLGAAHPRQEIRTLIAQRSALPFSIKKLLLCQADTWWYAAQGLTFLERLSLYFSTEKELRAAVAPTMPKYWFPRLLKDPTWEVRLAALRHPYVTPAQLRLLASDPDFRVRMAVACHRVTPQSVLENLKRDERPEVRNAVRPRMRRV